jgi:hypothetical protein
MPQPGRTPSLWRESPWILKTRRQIGKGGDELIPVFVPEWKREAIEEPRTAYRQHIFQQNYLHQVKQSLRTRITDEIGTAQGF